MKSWAPHTVEKIELAKMGLGLKEVTFDGDGDISLNFTPLAFIITHHLHE